MKRLSSLSIVTTLYNSSSYIEKFYSQACKYAEMLTNDFEIVFVNDGSMDNSLEKAVSIYNQCDHVKVVDLSRNFGQHKAIMTGLMHAEKDYVFTLDSDLEEPMELIVPFAEKMETENSDVVYGVQNSRRGGFFEKFSGSFFYKLYNMLCRVKIPENFTACMLMNRSYVDALVLHKESELFFAGVFFSTGFKQVELKIDKSCDSPTSYTFRKKMEMVFNSFTSFSAKPLYFVFYFSFGILGLTILFLLYKIMMKILYDNVILGYTSIIISIWFFGSLILLVQGIIGIYISKIYMEVKRRPFTIVKKIFSRGEKNNDAA